MCQRLDEQEKKPTVSLFNAIRMLEERARRILRMIQFTSVDQTFVNSVLANDNSRRGRHKLCISFVNTI